MHELQHKDQKEEPHRVWYQLQKIQMKFSVYLLALVHSNACNEPTAATYCLLKK